MNQLISNVLMQPKPDAVESLTLVEKLENFRDTQTYYEATFADAVIDSCIDIVKQHSDWISVDERLPEPNKIVLVAIHYPQYYVPDFMYVITADYDEVRKKWSSITNVAELKNVVYWQPFPKLPKPPSEVQE